MTANSTSPINYDTLQYAQRTCQILDSFDTTDSPVKWECFDTQASGESVWDMIMTAFKNKKNPPGVSKQALSINNHQKGA
ncbi:hypothetical protein IJJ08_05320 [bacterium]|nr:hypothetical protein [bacterium]